MIESLPEHPDREPFDLPTSDELVGAVRHWIESTLMSELEGATRFHARVAANMLAIVQREIVDGGASVNAHRARLAGLGFESDRDLADAIRRGDLDDKRAEVIEAVMATLADELAIDNPGYAQFSSAGVSAAGDSDG
ncbi:MAG: hypothetical protein KDB16_00675 [Acidimicrobiales bacterium]|nr:hypothetical protein [Acidimicrobiales bacterium]